MIVFVKRVRKLIITLFGYIHPIKLLYLLDTLHHIHCKKMVHCENKIGVVYFESCVIIDTL